MKLTIMDGFKFGVGLCLAYTVYSAIGYILLGLLGLFARVGGGI